MKRGRQSLREPQSPFEHRKTADKTNKCVDENYIRDTLRFVDYAENEKPRNVGGVFRDFDEEWSE